MLQDKIREPGALLAAAAVGVQVFGPNIQIHSSMVSSLLGLRIHGTRPEGRKAAKRNVEHAKLFARQVAATEELVKVTKKKAEAFNESNKIDLMATKPDDITEDGKEYFRLKQKLALEKMKKLVEQDWVVKVLEKDDVCGGGREIYFKIGQ